MRRVLKYILCLCLLAGSVAAGNDGGTTSPFSLGAGARDLALGGADLGVSSGYTAVYWNPASLASVQRIQFGGFHSNPYESDVAYQYAGAVVPTVDLGSFSLAVFRLGVDGIEERDAGNLLLGEIEDNRLGIYFGYSRSIGNYDFGSAVVIEHHSLGDFSATSSPGINLAVQRRFETGLSLLGDVTIAAVGRNLIRPKFKLADESTDYPLGVTLGVSTRLIPSTDWQHEASLSAAVTRIDGADIRLAAGLEYSLYDLLHLRGGVNDGRLAFGVGLSYGSFGFDYALVDRDMGSIHMFNLTTSFGASMSEKSQRRAAEREAAFNGLMSDRLTAQNRETVSRLVTEGKELLEAGDMVQAVSQFDRALFLARANNMDTSEVYALLEETETALRELNHKRLYREYVDSAQLKFDNRDFLAARYFSGLALAEVPNSQQARNLLNRADSAMSESASKEETIQSRLLMIDSLLNYGHFDRALSVAVSLDQIAPEDARVKQAFKKATFERLRATASSAFGATEYKRAINVLDSALALFPAHQWCLDLKEQAAFAVRQATAESVVEAVRPEASISREVLDEVDMIYRQAQKDFEAGNLTAAIEAWERVERLTPDYQSVREYLVSAYKYVGVELYSKNRLAEAVTVWKKARRLAPENREIASYIERTETEIRKLQELSYEHE